MKADFSSVLSIASKELLDDIYIRYENTEMQVSYVELSPEQTMQLGEKILVLPDDDIAMLLFRHAFRLDFETIAGLLKQEKIKGKILYLEQLLSSALGLAETEKVAEESLRSACRIALKEYTELTDKEVLPKYSRSFIKSMEKIKALRKRPSLIYSIVQKAAILLVVFGISFGIALGVSAELREYVCRWFVETFPQYSNFSLESNEGSKEMSYEELLLYRPTFIPDGYTEIPGENFPTSIFFTYDNEDGDLLGIIGCMPNSGPLSLNTEGVNIEKTTFRGEEAFYWEKDDVAYFSFILDGFQFSITGQLEKDDIVKIAENMKKK